MYTAYLTGSSNRCDGYSLARSNVNTCLVSFISSRHRSRRTDSNCSLTCRCININSAVISAHRSGCHGKRTITINVTFETIIGSRNITNIYVCCSVAVNYHIQSRTILSSNCSRRPNCQNTIAVLTNIYSFTFSCYRRRRNCS